MAPLSLQATLINEYSSVVQPVQLAFQQQIQTLKTQHEEFVSSLAQQPQMPMPQMEADVKATPPPPAPPPAPTPTPAIPPTTQPGMGLPLHPALGASSPEQDSRAVLQAQPSGQSLSFTHAGQGTSRAGVTNS